MISYHPILFLRLSIARPILKGNFVVKTLLRSSYTRVCCGSVLRILLAFAHHERVLKEVYCCLKRHGCSVLPKKEISTFADKKKFKQYPIGELGILKK
ncbi:IS481 family transposase domain protein [Rickettsiales endosymbiont of Paramecium tredecaurelia]|nr:IS481 family transposase domain protein [Candidatus Sarmatiella mevalonica]